MRLRFSAVFFDRRYGARSSRRLRWQLVIVWAVLAVVAPSGTAHATDAWRFDVADGGRQIGELARLTSSDVAFVSPDGEVSLPAVAVRVIEPVEKPPVAATTTRLWLTDGSLLAGDAVETRGTDLILTQQGRPLRVPQQAVARIAWNLSDEVPESQTLTAAPDWQAMLPAAVDSDLIVIRKATDPEPVYQGVPCAILSIDQTHVTVALDDDRIPVKRERVAGLVWLRSGPDAAVQGPVVDLVAGRLLTTAVDYLPQQASFRFETAWSRELVLPAAAVRRIDLAAGRTVSLAEQPAEETRVEPFFAGLAQLDDLAVAFAPRILTADLAESAGGGPMIVATPRTSLRWKLPTGVQRLRMQAEVERPQAGGGELAVIVDGTERLRCAVSPEQPEAVAIDVDVAGGRRLEIVVDFPAASVSGQAGLGRLRLLDPRLEK